MPRPARIKSDSRAKEDSPKSRKPFHNRTENGSRTRKVGFLQKNFINFSAFFLSAAFVAVGWPRGIPVPIIFRDYICHTQIYGSRRWGDENRSTPSNRI